MQIDLRISRMFAAAAMVLVAAGAFSALAIAAPEQTRESYVAQVEPICKTNAKADERLLGGVRAQIKKGELRVAAGKFAQAATASGKAVKQLGAVPQPLADQAKLKKWLGYLGDEQKLLGEIGKALKAGKKSKAFELSARLEHNGSLANNSVLVFEFNYCLIESSRFS
jgi:hypothetical protein